MELGHTAVVLQSLILIAVANGGPVLFARMLGRRFAAPIDGGFMLRDGHPITWSFQDLAWARRSYRSRGLYGSPHPSPMAGGCAHRGFRHGGRLPLVLRQTAIGARTEQHGAWSRSGSRVAASCSRFRRFPAAYFWRHRRDCAGVLPRRTRDIASPLRCRLTGSALLRRAAHKLVQGDLRPIVKAHRNDRRPRPD